VAPLPCPAHAQAAAAVATRCAARSAAHLHVTGSLVEPYELYGTLLLPLSVLHCRVARHPGGFAGLPRGFHCGLAGLLLLRLARRHRRHYTDAIYV
jgi:hypothetical protein